MQKIEFINSLEQIVIRLLSNEIITVFEGALANPGAAYNFSLIKPYLFTSKSNFDNMVIDEDVSAILNYANASDIYKGENLTSLMNSVTNTSVANLLTQPIVMRFYDFHRTLIATLNISKHFLLNNLINEDFAENLENGVVLFQILIEGEGLETEIYIKIFTALNELINVLSNVENENYQKSELILLDSGSDTNLGVKTGVDTAKSLFLLFKEMWDYIFNRKFYKQTQQNKALLESFDVRKKIKKNLDDGVIDEEEAQKYNHIIKTRTEELIGMQVLPKEIVNQHTVVTNKNLLSEYQEFKKLGTGGIE